MSFLYPHHFFAYQGSENRTRDCLAASQRTTNWATPHPNFRELQFLFHFWFYVRVKYSVVPRGLLRKNGVLKFKIWLMWCRPKTSILDKSLSRGKQEVSLSAFALLFSETVQYCQVISCPWLICLPYDTFLNLSSGFCCSTMCVIRKIALPAVHTVLIFVLLLLKNIETTTSN